MTEDIISVYDTWERVAKGMKNGGNSLCINGTWLQTSNTTSTIGAGTSSVSTGSLTSAGASADTGPTTSFARSAVQGLSLRISFVVFSVLIGSVVVAL